MIYHLALSLEVPSDYQGPRGTAQNDKSLKCFISAPPLETPWRCASKPHGTVPRNPIALCLETPAPPLETPWCCALKPQVRRASKPLGTNFETKMFKFRCFLGPSDQNHFFLVEDPFDVDIDLCLVNVIVSDF